MFVESAFKGRRRLDQEAVHILLLEDDPLFADLIQTQLRRTVWVNSKLETAGTLAEAAAKLARGRFALVLTDLNLPDSKGLATVEALTRAGEHLIIVLTGDRNPALRAAAMECGAYDFLSKDELTAPTLERLVRLAAMQAQTFASLRESEARFRGLVTQSSDWYWEVDEELRFTQFEGRIAEASGSDPKRAIGKRLWEIDAVKPVSHDWEHLRGLAAQRQPFRDFVYSRAGDDGTVRYIRVSGEPVQRADRSFAGYRGLAVDVTAHWRAEEELRRFRLAMEHSADMILLIDRATLRHVDVNSAACRLLGYSREELLTMGPADILPVPRADLERAYDRLIADPSHPSGMNSYYRCKDGSHLPFESTRRAIRSGEAWVIAAISRDIRDRLAAEAALRESEALKGAVLDASVDAIITMNHLGRVVEFNAAATKHFGYSREAAVGKDLAELIIPPERREAHRAGLERYLATGQAGLLGRRIEIEALRIDGTRFDAEVTVMPIEGLEPPVFAGMIRDITRAKRAATLLKLEHSVTRCLAEAESAEAALAEALRTLCEAEGWQSGRYFALDEGAAALRLRAAWSGNDGAMLRFNEASRGLVVLPGAGLVGQAWDSGEALWVSDIDADARVAERELARAGGVRGMAAFPVRFGTQTIGVISLSSARMREPDARLLQTMRVICSQLGQFLRRKDIESGLRRSEERFRGLTGLSSDMYWEQDAEYRFTLFRGNATHRLIGRKRWEQTYVNMSAADWAAHIAQLDARKPFRDLELCRLDEAGEQVWFSVSGEPVFDEAGAFTGYRGVGTDITERKHAQRLVALEHAVTRCLADAEDVEDALRAAIRAVCESESWESGRYFHLDEPAGLMRFRAGWSAEGDAMRKFNEASRSVTFARGTGLVGTVWQTGEPLWVADVGKDPRVKNRALAAEAGVHGSVVFPVGFEDSIIGVLSLSSRALREPDERLLQAMRVIGSQIGQFLKRKEAEVVLRESEERFRSLSALSSDWFWETDAEHRFKGTPPRVTEITGFKAPTYVGKRRWEVPGLAPAEGDWDAHRAMLERRESFRDLELVQSREDGTLAYLHVSGEPVYAADGSFRGYRGTAKDVSARKREEDQLRRFRAAMDMSIDAIYLVDRARMQFVDVNDAACRGVGYTREQLLRMGPQDLLKTPRAELERAYDEVIAKGTAGVRSENSYAGANGQMRWTELHRRALRAGEGWIIVSISHDITERKLAEQHQAAHLRRQERIARFGQLALGKRELGELIEEAVQNVLEGLGAETVAYAEPGPAEGEMVVRATAGGSTPDAEPATVLVRGERDVRGALYVFMPEGRALAAEETNFIEAVASVLSTALQRIDSEGRLAYLAQFDPLTGLPNRALLADRFSQMIVQARRRGSPLGVLFIDLDEFKLVNDTLGHAGGDELLKEVSVRLQASVRSGDTVARISGDEFAVVLADLARPEDAAVVAQKIIDRLAAPVPVHGQEVFVTGSIGIALFPGDGADAESLIGAADAAMYRAKQSGRNAYQFFTAEINQRSRSRAQLGSELRRALERDEFFLVYQPKVRLADGGQSGAEALLRWRHPERGVVSPAEFVPVLEETGLIVPVGEWVLRRACEDLKSWRAAGLEPGPVSVNLSARQFRLADLDARLKAIVAAAGVVPALVELEITESQLVQDPDHAIRMMRSLCDAGMRIAIDDFGTGYSSLSYLTRFPVGSLKIDRSFVRDVTEDASDATIVRTIIEMAHTLGFQVVAEGIETEAQAEYLRRHRCDEGQGYLFARPMPAADLAARLAAVT